MYYLKIYNIWKSEFCIPTGIDVYKICMSRLDIPLEVRFWKIAYVYVFASVCTFMRTKYLEKLKIV